jgi:hypothetical protein
MVTTITIQLNSYTTAPDQKKMTDTLKYNGFAGFWPVFSKAPVVGAVQIRDRKWNVRWASQRSEGDNRAITVATDEAMFYVGGSRVDPKPRAGYTMAVILLTVNKMGEGNGTFAPAARVKPNADSSGFILDGYSGLIDLVKVAKLSQSGAK